MPNPKKTLAKTVTAAKDAYIVELSGGGDTFVSLVAQDVWDWIEEGGPPPESLVAIYASKNEPNATRLGNLLRAATTITIGPWRLSAMSTIIRRQKLNAPPQRTASKSRVSTRGISIKWPR